MSAPVSRRCASEQQRHPKPLQIRKGEVLAAGLAGLLASGLRHAKGQPATGAEVVQQDPYLLRLPTLISERQHAFLGKKSPPVILGELDLALARRFQARQIVLAGQIPQVDVGALPKRRTDGNGLVVTR